MLLEGNLFNAKKHRLKKNLITLKIGKELTSTCSIQVYTLTT